ncbi:hypothetical protein LX32DRAFT_351941 [Colletotrichum zoysiae]|uniref:Uncharacterized protein n=1 Tax=Colletotrichum zoysiae TaxID=1216348 RepID=A0AAD9HKJ9_9PEZI|nr:hypothetical protein LX32DRAFT_351941 [Colletotrichum zoysiae]
MWPSVGTVGMELLEPRNPGNLWLLLAWVCFLLTFNNTLVHMRRQCLLRASEHLAYTKEKRHRLGQDQEGRGIPSPTGPCIGQQLDWMVRGSGYKSHFNSAPIALLLLLLLLLLPPSCC